MLILFNTRGPIPFTDHEVDSAPELQLLYPLCLPPFCFQPAHHVLPTHSNFPPLRNNHDADVG